MRGDHLAQRRQVVNLAMHCFAGSAGVLAEIRAAIADRRDHARGSALPVPAMSKAVP